MMKITLVGLMRIIAIMMTIAVIIAKSNNCVFGKVEGRGIIVCFFLFVFFFKFNKKKGTCHFKDFCHSSGP